MTREGGRGGGKEEKGGKQGKRTGRTITLKTHLKCEEEKEEREVGGVLHPYSAPRRAGRYGAAHLDGLGRHEREIEFTSWLASSRVVK
jgi:hypothetical protein